jgi:DNA-binding NtrC family response regulator
VEEKTFNRVGGREDLQVDLRLIAATNRILRDEVQAGRFREDLYYRLHVLEVELPPLAGRREDIPALSAFFLSQIAAGRDLALGSNASRLLASYAWPGNVRELRNALEHAVAVCSSKIIQPHHLPKEVRLASEPSTEADLDEFLRRWAAARIQAGVSYKQLYAEMESALLKYLMQRFDQKPSVLARILKINRGTLLKKRRCLGLDS